MISRIITSMLPKLKENTNVKSSFTKTDWLQNVFYKEKLEENLRFKSWLKISVSVLVSANKF